MLKERVQTVQDVDVVIMDSISSVSAGDAGTIVVSASHGGASSGEFAMRHRLGLVFFNDAGVGKDDAGVRSLAMLEGIGVPAATISHASARIGDARDHWDHGVLSHVNDAAQARGLRPGQDVRAAAQAFLARPQ